MKRPRVLMSTDILTRPPKYAREDAVTGRNYSLAVLKAGGLPCMVAVLQPQLATMYASDFEALVLTGGADIDPLHFGQEPRPGLERVDERRDEFEFALYRAFRDLGRPVLGVCRGHQLINVAEGGSLHQHIPMLPSSLQHKQLDSRGDPLHVVELSTGSRLAAAFGTMEIRTNSYHHQAVDQVGARLKAVACTSDGLVEALEESYGPWVLGVQWHPEMAFTSYPNQLVPFELLVEAAARVGH